MCKYQMTLIMLTKYWVSDGQSQSESQQKDICMSTTHLFGIDAVNALIPGCFRAALAGKRAHEGYVTAIPTLACLQLIILLMSLTGVFEIA